jgi:hypothetical protein
MTVTDADSCKVVLSLVFTRPRMPFSHHHSRSPTHEISPKHALSSPHLTSPSPRISTLTNNQLPILREIILRDLQIQRRRTSPHSSRDIVMGTVAGTEPPAVITCFADGDTA